LAVTSHGLRLSRGDSFWNHRLELALCGVGSSGNPPHLRASAHQSWGFRALYGGGGSSDDVVELRGGSVLGRQGQARDRQPASSQRKRFGTCGRGGREADQEVEQGKRRSRMVSPSGFYFYRIEWSYKT